MTNSRTKGAVAERAVVAALHQLGWLEAERRLSGGPDDRGDITGIHPRLVLEVKDHATPRWGPWLNQIGAEIAAAEADHGLLVVKRRGVTDARQWLAVTTLDQAVVLLEQAGYTPQGAEQ